MMQTPQDQQDLRRQVLRDTDLIPPLPEVLVRIVALLNEPDTQPEDIEELMRFDHSLVARLLGMVNSPFFGLRRQLGSIRDAIMVLGYQNLRSLLMVTSTSKYLDRDFPKYGYAARGLWRHSVAVAAAAKALAGELGEPAAVREEIFTAALLHDIGKMVLHGHLCAFPDARLAEFASMAEAERELLGMTHAEAGLLVCDKWNLEPLLCTVVAEHHHPHGPSDHARPLSIVRLANAVVHEMGVGYLPERAPEPVFGAEDLEFLGLSQPAWDSVVETLVEEVESALAHIANVYS